MSIRTSGVIGAGGVGGYFGGKLCRLQDDRDVQVSFVARGEHLRAIQAHGLSLDTESDGEFTCRPALATDDLRQLPPLDLCLICVKVFDLPRVLAELRNAIGQESIVLPLLNGVDIYERVRKVIREGTVLPACVYVGTHIERPGRVVQQGGACKIYLGDDPQRPSFSPQLIVDVLSRARIKVEYSPQIQTEIWQKYIFICAFGLVSAAYDRTLGEIRDDAKLRDDVEAIMREIAAVAVGKGVTLPDDVVAASLARAGSFPPDAKMSFQRDVERPDRWDERDLFVGTMTRNAHALGLAIPRTRAAAELIEVRKPFPRQEASVRRKES